MFKKLMVAGMLGFFIFICASESWALNLGVDTKSVSFKGLYLGGSMTRDYKDPLGHFKPADVSFDAGLSWDIRNFQLILTPIKLNLGSHTDYHYEISLKAFFK